MAHNEPNESQSDRDDKVRELGVIAIGLHDLTCARTACLMLADWKPEDGLMARETLQAGLCTSYGRAFAKGGGATVLPKKYRPTGDDGPIHKELLDMRHNWIAHSNFQHRQVRVFPPGSTFSEGAEQKINQGSFACSVHQEQLSPKALEIVLVLVNRLCAELEAEIGPRCEELFKGRIVPSCELGLDEI